MGRVGEERAVKRWELERLSLNGCRAVARESRRECGRCDGLGGGEGRGKEESQEEDSSGATRGG